MNSLSVSINSVSLFDKMLSSRTRYLKCKKMYKHGVVLQNTNFITNKREKKNWVVTHLSACSLCVPLKFVNETNCVRNVLAVITILTLANFHLIPQ